MNEKRDLKMLCGFRLYITEFGLLIETYGRIIQLSTKLNILVSFFHNQNLYN